MFLSPDFLRSCCHLIVIVIVATIIIVSINIFTVIVIVTIAHIDLVIGITSLTTTNGIIGSGLCIIIIIVIVVTIFLATSAIGTRFFLAHVISVGMWECVVSHNHNINVAT